MDSDDEPSFFNLIENESQVDDREENVEFSGNNNVLFKIILEEQGIERKKYLSIDL
jgi:hypothetical protein